jgi:Flp pilus assembly protein TadB
MIYLGQNDFARIQRDYRRAQYQLDIDRIEKSASRELTSECLKKAAREQEDKDLCLSQPPQMVQTKIEQIIKSRTENMANASRKRAMFYITFGLFFIIVPLSWLYLTILIVVKLCTSVRIV